MKKTTYILLLFSVFLIGCKTPKNLTTDTKQKEQKNIENNVSIVEATTLDEVMNRAIQKFFNEKLNININKKVYDTEKPADPETGKPPIKEETNINLSKETNETTAESAESKKTEAIASQLVDKSKDKSKFEGSEKTKTETGLKWWQKLISGIVLAIVGIWGLGWGIKRLLKWIRNR